MPLKLSTLKISPLSKKNGLAGLDKVFADYNFYNMWSAENLDISGTTTTALDYAGEHDLSNPLEANQPTYNSSSVNFNSRPTLSFDGVNDYLQKLTSNWRGSDNSGVFISVYKAFGTQYAMLCTADNSSNSYWYAMYQNNLNKGGLIRNGSEIAKSVTDDDESKIISISGNGSDYKVYRNGEDDTDTTGTYNWLDSMPTQRDDISIGAVTRSSIFYDQFEWAMSGYLQFTNYDDIVSLHNDLKFHYQISTFDDTFDDTF